MKQPDRPPRLFRQCWPVVWLAGRIVPQTARAEWYARWRYEIWHWAAFLEESGRLSANSQYELVRHCWRAFGDAFWVRFDRERFLHRSDQALRAPSFVLAAAGLMLLATAVASGGFARTRLALLPLPVPAPAQMGTVQYLGEWWSMVVSAVPADWVQTWRKESHSIAGIAEYSLEEPTLTGLGLRERMGVARVGPSFFDLARARPAAGSFFHDGDACAGCIVLSYELWQRRLHGRANVVGRTLEVNGEKVTVVGIAPRDFWIPASGVAAWVTPTAQPTGTSRSMWPVGAVVRVRDGVALSEAERELQQVIDQFGPGSAVGRAWPGGTLQIVPFQRRARQSLATYGVLVLVALLATLVAGLARFHPHRARVGLWTAFLGLKTLLLLGVCSLACIEFTPRLARLTGRAFDSSVWPLALWMSLVLSVAVLVWSVRDQRYRCPVCLTRLELPVLVGEPSHMLFGFGATEFVCPRGHGLLHVSDSHCSWIDPEEWTGLDASWQALFKDKEP